jgi:hypothetical protein
MSLYLKRLSRTNARLDVLVQTETDLQAQFRELTKLRELFRTAQADRQNGARGFGPAPLRTEQSRL